ncbi:MAG: 50S ribosomal protein L21e [Euryarchaeota archaeon]|nr:50S ribosomal protein L21e [Euryarchaeota archaeon]
MSVRRKTRTKLRRGLRERSSIRRAVQQFDPGATVHIDIDPSIHKGMPHPRFTGYTGHVLDRRGRAYIVQIREGHKDKTLLVRPEHLKVAP